MRDGSPQYHRPSVLHLARARPQGSLSRNYPQGKRRATAAAR